MGGSALVAEQAQRPARSRERGFGQRSELVERVLRVGRREMALENAQHLVRLSAGRREPPLVWGLGCQELKHGTNLFSFFCPLARWWRASHRPTPIDPARQAAAAPGLP